jgi:hypothetical protein
MLHTFSKPFDTSISHEIEFPLTHPALILRDRRADAYCIKSSCHGWQPIALPNVAW